MGDQAREGGRGGAGDAAVRGRGRSPASPPPPRLQLRVLFCPRRKQRGVEALIGAAESPAEPEPGRGGEGVGEAKRLLLGPLPQPWRVHPDPQRWPQAPHGEHNLGLRLRVGSADSVSLASPFHPTPVLPVSTSRVRWGEKYGYTTRGPEGPHGPKALFTLAPSSPLPLPVSQGSCGPWSPLPSPVESLNWGGRCPASSSLPDICFYCPDPLGGGLWRLPLCVHTNCAMHNSRGRHFSCRLCRCV